MKKLSKTELRKALKQEVTLADFSASGTGPVKKMTFTPLTLEYTVYEKDSVIYKGPSQDLALDLYNNISKAARVGTPSSFSNFPPCPRAFYIDLGKKA